MIRARLARTSLLLAVALGLSGSACAQGSDNPSQPDASVTLSVKFPVTVTIDRQPAVDARQKVEATFTLVNSSKSDVTLEASNDCVSHTWYITDGGDQPVDDEMMCPMIYEPVTLTIKAGESFSATRDVTLTRAKYTDGATYKLHVAFWTINGETTFTAKVVQ
jgi:hypothetical protein